MAMGMITITPQRALAVDFTWPYATLSTLCFFTTEPPPLPKSYSLIWPFTYESWITLGISLVVLGIASFAILTAKPKTTDVWDLVSCYQYLVMIIFEQSTFVSAILQNSTL